MRRTWQGGFPERVECLEDRNKFSEVVEAQN